MQCKLRHEYKYLCSRAQIEVLKRGIDRIMPMDAHAAAQGFYHIRSLYFDDAANTAYHANENGTEPREKYRIRMYNHDIASLRLELKRKQHGMTAKHSCPLTAGAVIKLISGQAPETGADTPPLLRQFLLQRETRRLSPVIVVDYDRIPYCYRPGNVRVTFDMNICSSSQVGRFLQPTLAERPVMRAGQHILEVKWDYCLPGFIKSSLQTQGLRRVSVSKYYCSRSMSTMGGIGL